MVDTQTASEFCPGRSNETAWFKLSEEEVASALKTSADKGLSSSESQQRLKACGKNVLPKKEAPPLWAIFLHQFASPLIYILIAAAGVSVLIGEWVDASFIMFIILLNAALGTFQEYKAEQSAQSLQQLLKFNAHVIRGGKSQEVPSEQVVPGDLVLLSSGDRVPADVRLIEASGLATDEALLTGESQSVDKKTEPITQSSLPVTDQTNMAFAGSTVTSGDGQGIVVKTGLNTEIGHIAETVSEREATKTPLITRMESFARKLSIAFLGIVVILSLIALYQGYPPTEVFLIAVALAVAAIPEGLPVAMTVALSIGSRRMAKRHVIVRKLSAVEGLGSCTYIASDKTGTLTLNRQTVKMVTLPGGERFSFSGEGYSGDGEVRVHQDAQPSRQEVDALKRMARAAVLTNEGILEKTDSDWQHQGDPVDVALLAASYKLGLPPAEVRDEHPIEQKIPYASERQFSAAFYTLNGQTRVAIKGAVEKLLPLCTSMATLTGDQPVNRERIREQSERMAKEGYRVLMIAEGVVEKSSVPSDPTESDLPPLTALGLTGMIDPLRPEAKGAIETCHQAGVQVALVTGDHPETAWTIARKLGLSQHRDEVVTGSELEATGSPDSPAYRERVRSASVFARVSPLQKLHIVEGLKEAGHYVAVTGDGVNDVPALKTAHIGVAMGSGSDIAKDTALLIITDNNFASLEAGIEEGRYAYDNVRKVIYLVLACGIAEIILVILALLSSLPLPLVAVQLLWLNMVTNGIQDVALAFEAGEKGSLQKPPRDPQQGIFDRLMIQENLMAGLTIGLVAFGTYRWLLASGMDTFSARNMVLLLMVLLQNLHALNARSELQSAFKVPLRNNWLLVGGILLAQTVHIVSMHVPFMQRILQVEAVSPVQWFALLLLSSLILLVSEIFKWYKRHHQPDSGDMSPSRAHPTT